MDPLLEALIELVRALELAGVSVVVIGAFAVRTYVDHPELRRTGDLDLLVPKSAVSIVEPLLVSRGYRVYSTGAWLRAERGSPAVARIIDIALDDIVDLSSFERFKPSLERVARRAERDGALLPVLSVEDLVAQKRIAAREKDLLDVVLLAGAHHATLDALRLRDVAEASEVEVAVRRGYLELLASARSGRLAQLWFERTGQREAVPGVDLALQRLSSAFEVPR